MVLEVNSEVLCANSEVFAGLIEDYKKGSWSGSGSGSNKMCRIEVPEVDNLGVFRETIELMFENEDGVTKRLLNIGVFRSIDVLEVRWFPLYFFFFFLSTLQLIRRKELLTKNQTRYYRIELNFQHINYFTFLI